MKRVSKSSVIAQFVCAALIAGAAAMPASGSDLQLPITGAGGVHVPVMSWKEIPFRTVIRQQYDFSCGSAAVATLLSYHYQRPTDEREVFAAMWSTGDQPTIRKSGFSMLDIKRFLSDAGYSAEGFRLTMDQLQKRQRPGLVILDLKGYKHFVVIKGISADGVLVGDPMTGLTRYSLQDFKSSWNGIFLVIADGPQATAPAFNVSAEWSPWSTAPLNDADLDTSISSFTNHLPPSYQITSGTTTSRSGQ